MDEAVEAARYHIFHYGACSERRCPDTTTCECAIEARNVIAAADAARAVGDEEVIETCKAGVRDYWEQAIQRSSQQRSVSDHIAKALRAAGLKVVRG